MHTVSLADCPPQPWKNGGGATRELLRWPRGGDWSLRLSIATIDRDGPFSPFPGIERWFAVVDGAGVQLEWPARRVTLRPGDEPLPFAGDDAPHCRLCGGTTTDINLMLQRAKGRGRMQAALPGRGWHETARWRGFYAARPARLHFGPHDTLELRAATLAWHDGHDPRTWHVELCDAPDTAGPAGWWIAFDPHVGSQGASP